MRILFCSEFYAPSVGGVGQSMRQIAEQLSLRGHHVTMATSKQPMRDFDILNGVHIEEFDVFGNLVGGIVGETQRYQDYVLNGNFDIVMIKSAQQWTFDALLPVLERIPILKVFIPTGFPSFYEPAYAAYYKQMPDILRKFDHLVFHASSYRDIDMAKEKGIFNYSIIPNGASQAEFNIDIDPTFRTRHEIPPNSVLLLTVGRFTGLKGHTEVAKAFSMMPVDQDKHLTMILNGNAFPFWRNDLAGFWSKFIGLVKSNDLPTAVRKIRTMTWGKLGVRLNRNFKKASRNKQVLVSDYTRPDLIQAYLAADLFVFASYVEYSPNVLYEAVASKTPFLSVPVGNSEEIAEWTGGGVICPAPRDDKGYTRVDPAVLADHMARLIRDEPLRKRLAEEGHRRWKERFTWDKISGEYEALFQRLVDAKATAVRNVV